MRRKDFASAPISIETCYAEGLSKDFFPVLLHVSGNKFVYHREMDGDTNKVTEGFCVCDQWYHTPKPLTTKQQLALNLLLWAGCKHKRLPIPFSQHDVEEANREWDKIVCDNPYLEYTFDEGNNLTKGDYEILKKARAKMENDDLSE